MHRPRLAAVAKWTAALLVAGVSIYLLFVGVVGQQSTQAVDGEVVSSFQARPEAIPGAVVFAACSWTMATERRGWSWLLGIGGVVFTGAHMFSFGAPLVPLALLSLVLLLAHALASGSPAAQDEGG